MEERVQLCKQIVAPAKGQDYLPQSHVNCGTGYGIELPYLSLMCLTMHVMKHVSSDQNFTAFIALWYISS